MARSKIDYGIDLGTTNSAISRMQNGEAVIKKTDTQNDTMPSCIFFNKKQAMKVGDTAYSSLKQDKLRRMLKPEEKSNNAFIEFKRTMGSDKSYFSSHMDKEYSSEELSAELLKTLNPLMNTDTLWKPHALLLLGDYFFFKKEYLKANEFYVQILTMKGLHEEIYKQARSQLALISND